MTALGNKQILADNLSFYMKKNKIDRNQLCEALDFKYSTVSEWLSAKKYPRIDNIEKMARFFNIPKSKLIEKNDPEPTEAKIDLSLFGNITPVKKIKLPMLGEIACGKPIFADEQHETFIEVDDSYGADFCLKATGDSMINAGIDSNDIVLIREAPIVENGEIAAVIIDDDATLKRVYYYKDKNKLVLQAENPRYEPLVYLNEELETIHILGKAVAVIKKL